MFQEVANQYLRLGEIEEITLESLLGYPKLPISSSYLWRWDLNNLNIFPKARQKLTQRGSLYAVLYHLPRPFRLFFFPWL